MKVVAWNLERKRPLTPTGSAAVRRIAAEEADVVVLTEARVGHLSSLGGYSVESQPPLGDRLAEDERKVAMWSRHPWRDVDQVGDEDMPAGRFVAGTTTTSIGDVRVIGVCVPWHMCDVRTDAKDRRPWEQHTRWLELFESLIEGESSLPLVIAGDLNQRIPRRRGGRRDVAELLAHVLRDFTVVTAGIPAGCQRQGIDHIVIDRRLEAVDVRGWPSDDGGVRMSDHDAVVAELAKDQ